MKTLVAGFGNVLRGDDGFGVAVLGRLHGDANAQVELLEVGTGGIRMAQELLGGYDRLIIIDAMTRGGAPGDLYVEEVLGVESVPEVDLHAAVPARALSMAKALKVLPKSIFIVGCEPRETEELTMNLSSPVADAVDRAASEVRKLLPMPQVAVAKRDEMLELLYWLEGEGFEGASTLDGIARFLTWPREDAAAVLESLAARGDVAHPGSEFRLTEVGRREAARRFADTFAPFLAQGHGECNDPNCDCTTSEGGVADCRANRA